MFVVCVVLEVVLRVWDVLSVVGVSVVWWEGIGVLTRLEPCLSGRIGEKATRGKAQCTMCCSRRGGTFGW